MEKLLIGFQRWASSHEINDRCLNLPLVKVIYSFLLPGEQFASWISVVFDTEPHNWKVSCYFGINWYTPVVVSVACCKKISYMKTVASCTCRNTKEMFLKCLIHFNTNWESWKKCLKLYLWSGVNGILKKNWLFRSMCLGWHRVLLP